MSVELISVHAPKCAGRSLITALATAYGAESLHLDYADHLGDPVSRYNIDPDGIRTEWQQSNHNDLANKRVIHGHFNLTKYASLSADIPRITFLRHPVERTISHYFYWQRLPRVNHALHDYCIDQKLDLLSFCRLPLIRYFYTHVMFRWVPMEKFDFVGCFENLTQDVVKLGSYLGVELMLGHENAGLAEEKTVDRSLRMELNQLLTKEIDFYQRWVSWTRYR